MSCGMYEGDGCVCCRRECKVTQPLDVVDVYVCAEMGMEGAAAERSL